MKYYKEELKIKTETFKALSLYLPEKDYAILDIETTGLSPNYSSIILVGMIIVNETGIVSHQFFSTMPNDELEILSNTAKLLSNCNYVITFNGRNFDIPFLTKRGVKHGVDIPNLFNLDLFILLKYYSDLPKILPKMNQKAIEIYAGIEKHRQDRISGQESVDLYNRYLETMSKDLEKKILLHNSDDLKQLLRLLSLIKNVDIHRAFYKTGFPIYGGIITGIELKKGNLIINGVSHSGIEYIAFPSLESPYHFQMSGKDGHFEITIPCESKEDNVFLDAKALLDSSAQEVLSTLPSYVNDYIIFKENKRFNYLDINLFAREVSRLALSRVKL